MQELLPQCFEFRATYNHLYGRENCKVCSQINEDDWKKRIEQIQNYKPKTKKFNLDAQPFEKKKKGMKLGADDFIPEQKESNQIVEIQYLDDDNDYDKEMNFYDEKFKDCECCHGFINNCNGETCSYLGQCYCIFQYELEEEQNQEQYQK